MRRRHRKQRGTTMIELIASIVIISVAVVGLMLAIGSVTGHSADPMVEQQAVAVAEAYLEEVTQAGFCDPEFVLPGQTCRSQCTGPACSSAACGGSGALHESSRPLYDDVCDYDGLSDGGARDRDGNPIAGLEAYSVAVDVVDSGVTLGSPAIDADAGQVVRIDVTVSYPDLEHDIRLSSHRANVQ